MKDLQAILEAHDEKMEKEDMKDFMDNYDKNIHEEELHQKWDDIDRLDELQKRKRKK